MMEAAVLADASGAQSKNHGFTGYSPLQGCVLHTRVIILLDA